MEEDNSASAENPSSESEKQKQQHYTQAAAADGEQQEQQQPDSTDGELQQPDRPGTAETFHTTVEELLDTPSSFPSTFSGFLWEILLGGAGHDGNPGPREIAHVLEASRSSGALPIGRDSENSPLNAVIQKNLSAISLPEHWNSPHNPAQDQSIFTDTKYTEANDSVPVHSTAGNKSPTHPKPSDFRDPHSFAKDNHNINDIFSASTTHSLSTSTTNGSPETTSSALSQTHPYDGDKSSTSDSPESVSSSIMDALTSFGSFITRAIIPSPTAQVQSIPEEPEETDISSSMNAGINCTVIDLILIVSV